MTASEAIDRVDRLFANEIPREEKLRWLEALDGTLVKEVCRGRTELPQVCPDYQGMEGLLASHPYDELYLSYLEMRIHDANGEIARYNNAMQKYNRALLAYMDYVTRTYEAPGAPVRFY